MFVWCMVWHMGIELTRGKMPCSTRSYADLREEQIQQFFETIARSWNRCMEYIIPNTPARERWPEWKMRYRAVRRLSI